MKRIIYRIFDRYFRKKAIKNHRKMWRWLAENPGKGKLDYLMLYDPNARLIHSCYLCEYAAHKMQYLEKKVISICKYCPLDWGGRACKDYGSLFDRWWISHFYASKKSSMAARQIAELPERKDR